MIAHLKISRVTALMLFALLAATLHSCGTSKINTPSGPETQTETQLYAIVRSGVLDATNNHIASIAVVALKGSSVADICNFDDKPEGWKLVGDSWMEADSLLIFANLSSREVSKITPKMDLKLFNELLFGELGPLGAATPYPLRGVIRQSDLAQHDQGRLEVTLTPMVSCVTFKNPDDVAIDNIAVANVAHTTQASASPITGSGRVTIDSPQQRVFKVMLYPCKEFTISITQGKTTLTKSIETLRANEQITIDVDGATPQPPVGPDKDYKLTINNSDHSITNGQTVTLPSGFSSLSATLEENLDLALRSPVNWIRAAESLALVSSHDNGLMFVASFTQRAFEREVVSARYIVDSYYNPEATRSANFDIVDRATTNTIASFVVKQIGGANIELSAGDISPGVASMVNGRMEVNQMGGELQFVVKSSTNNITIEANAELISVGKSSDAISQYEYKHLLTYKIEPSANTNTTKLKLTVTDPQAAKSVSMDIWHAPLIMTAERSALINIYHKLGGINWSPEASKGWSSGYDLNQWAGVTTNSQGRVSAITLKQGSNIVGQFALEFTQLTSLESLIIGANSVTGSIPPQIKELKLLKTFKTTGNQMGGDLPRELGQLTALSDLDISNQYHTGKIWRELQTIPAFADQASFTQKVRRQRVADSATEILLPLDQSQSVRELRGATLSKVAQSYTISLPSDMEATSFEYSSQPTGHTLNLAYKRSDIMLDNKTMVEATVPVNSSQAAILYTIKLVGRNRTTGTIENYTCKIEQSNQTIERRDGDVRLFMDNDRTVDKSGCFIFMGDGFILEDLQPGCDYDKQADNILSYIFSKEPFSTYKDLFKVYVIYVESPKRGLDGTLGTWYNSTGYPVVNAKKVKEYADKAAIGIYARLIAMNMEDWGVGTGLMINGMNALFQVKNEHTAIHEFAHIFGLGDEYDNGGYSGAKPNIRTIPNLDTTNDLKAVKWKHFIGLPGYEDVGAYEGGAYQTTGVWRPEKESIMKKFQKSFNHFNAPSREALVKKFMYLADEPYSFEEFLRLDKPTKQPQ